MEKYYPYGIIILLFAAISFMSYFLFIHFYPFSFEDKDINFYNTLLIIKSIILGANLIADAIVISRIPNLDKIFNND